MKLTGLVIADIEGHYRRVASFADPLQGLAHALLKRIETDAGRHMQRYGHASGVPIELQKVSAEDGRGFLAVLLAYAQRGDTTLPPGWHNAARRRQRHPSAPPPVAGLEVELLDDVLGALPLGEGPINWQQFGEIYDVREAQTPLSTVAFAGLARCDIIYGRFIEAKRMAALVGKTMLEFRTWTRERDVGWVMGKLDPRDGYRIAAECEVPGFVRGTTSSTPVVNRAKAADVDDGKAEPLH